MYAREVDGQTLTFGVAGRLYKDSLLMYDQETGTAWSNLAGEGLLGPFQGRRLEQVPSVLTDWESWRRLHPEGTVVLLEKNGREYRRDFYREPEQFVLGIASGARARAWDLAELGRRLAVNDEWDREPVVAVFDPASSTAALYSRTLSAQVLTFNVQEGTLRDAETGSIWDPITGQAVGGPLAGQGLVRLPAIVSYRRVWQQFHAGSD